MVFNWVDVVISLGIVQGLFLILSLARIKNRNVSLNRILKLLLSLTTFMLIGRLLYFQFPAGSFDQVALLFDTVIFLFGPTVYALTMQLLYTDSSNKVKWPIHLIPAGIHLAIAIILLSLSQEYFMTLARKGWIMPYYKAIELLAILSNTIYILASFWTLAKYQQEEKNQFSFQQNPQRFMKLFLVSCLILIVLWMLNAIRFQLGVGFIKFMRYDFIWSSVPFLTYVIGYYMQRQPELFRINRVDSSKPSSKRLGTEKINVMKASLEKLMLIDKVYANNNLTLSALSEMMNVKPNDLSWLLNESYSSTFYDFINQYRVNQFLTKVENNEHLKSTILGLAIDCGFNAKSTFNKAFKKATGKTPSEYINNLGSRIDEFDNKISA